MMPCRPAGRMGRNIAEIFIAHFVGMRKKRAMPPTVTPARLPSVLVIDENAARAAIIVAGLREAGHDRVTAIHDLAGVAARIAALDPDVIVIDIETPSRDVLESLFTLSRAAQRPVAMFVDRSDHSMMEAAIDAGVSAYVVNGLSQERIKPILDMAVSRFNAFSRLRRELAEARGELENRKVIDRAKSILMKSRGVDEPEAYRLMRTAAMNQNRTIAEIAQSLVLAAGLMGP
jgi:two-component system, response regulator / RNA-binding antiterminator